MVYQILRQSHLKEVPGLTQNRETMTFQNLTTLDLYNILCRRAHMNRMIMKEHLIESLITFVFTLTHEGATIQIKILIFHDSAFR